MTRKKQSIKSHVSSNSAAYWLHQGGFAWWSHVACYNNHHTAVDEGREEPANQGLYGDDAVSDEESEQSKPCGTRKNRKALAVSKRQPWVEEWSDNSSDEEGQPSVVERVCLNDAVSIPEPKS